MSSRCRSAALRHAWVWLVVCVVFAISFAGAVTVAGCGECTLYAKKTWCPSSMTCHPQENCTCDVPCMDFRDCFFTEPTCIGCVSTFGVFCHQPNAKSTTPGNPCFFPTEKAAQAVEEGEQGTVRTPQTKLPTCEAHCTGDGARCISVVADCPGNPVDRVSVLAATAAIAVSLVLGVLSVAWALRRVFSSGTRAQMPVGDKKTV